MGVPCDVCGELTPRNLHGGQQAKRCGEACRDEARRRRNRASYAADPQRFIATVKRYQQRNPDSVRFRSMNRPPYPPELARRTQLRTRYGMTLEQYDALLDAQDGVCAICHRPERKQLRGRTLPLSVDHDHTSGASRGLLCARCNLMLGFLEDPLLYGAATAYLRRHRSETEVG